MADRGTDSSYNHHQKIEIVITIKCTKNPPGDHERPPPFTYSAIPKKIPFHFISFHFISLQRPPFCFFLPKICYISYFFFGGWRVFFYRPQSMEIALIIKRDVCVNKLNVNYFTNQSGSAALRDRETLTAHNCTTNRRNFINSPIKLKLLIFPTKFFFQIWKNVENWGCKLQLKLKNWIFFSKVNLELFLG